MTSEEGRVVGGRYRLDRRIGSGAMGVVWQAYDERLRRAVAVKQLRLEPGLDPSEADEARQRAMREGRIAARLHHPNAVSVFDVVDEDDAPWLVMEYVPSRSLAAEMTRRKALPPEEVGRIGAQVAHALVAAHAAGIVHRDIKPANVLLGDDGTVKITDFGISRAAGDVSVTKTGLIAGTPAYLAPEVAYGQDPEAPSDVFSLGSTLYAAVEGQPPFGLSENTLSLLHAVAAGRINPPRRAGVLTDVLVHLLNADPAARPNATTAAYWLDAVARGSRPNIEPVSPETLAAMAAATAIAPTPPYVVPNAGPTQAITTVAGHRGPDTLRGLAPVPMDRPPRRNRRPVFLAGIGIAAVALLAGVLLLSGLFGRTPTSNRTPPSTPGTTAPNGYQQVPQEQPDLVATTISQPTRSRTTLPPAPTTTNVVTTLPTTTRPPVTTTAPPTTTQAQGTSSPNGTSVAGGTGNAKP